MGRHHTRVDPVATHAQQAGPAAGLLEIDAAFRASAGQPGAAAAAAGQPWPGNPDGMPDVWPLYLSPEQAAAAALFDEVDWGPPTGRAWRIESMVVQFAGASSVSVYREAVQPQNLRFTFPTSGEWEPKKFMLLPGSRMVVQAVGGGATIGCIEGEQIALRALARYLG